jgi:glycosyltransferase involved in cell wall biosynthesis
VGEAGLNGGTPVTLIEAMAARKPVLATEVGVVPDLLGSIDGEEIEGYKVAE